MSKKNKSSAAIESMLTDAIALHQADNVRAAIKLYKKILHAFSEDYRALHLLGAATGQAGDWKQGIALIEKSLQLKPDNPEAHYNLGIALKTLERFDEAVLHYQQATL